MNKKKDMVIVSGIDALSPLLEQYNKRFKIYRDRYYKLSKQKKEMIDVHTSEIIGIYSLKKEFKKIGFVVEDMKKTLEDDTLKHIPKLRKSLMKDFSKDIIFKLKLDELDNCFGKSKVILTSTFETYISDEAVKKDFILVVILKLTEWVKK